MDACRVDNVVILATVDQYSDARECLQQAFGEALHQVLSKTIVNCFIIRDVVHLVLHSELLLVILHVLVHAEISLAV